MEQGFAPDLSSEANMTKSTATAETHTAAQALIGAGLEAALEGRRKAWFGSLDEALTGLAGKVEGFDPERLAEDEALLSAVAFATRLALETHGAARLEALRNVVLNAAAGVVVDDVTHTTFMGLIDRFSDLHLRILRAMASPLTAPEIAALEGGGIGVSLEWVIRTAFLPVAPVYAVLAAIKDLETAGLVQPLYKLQAAILTKDGPTGVCVTPAAERFLRFIAAPAALH